MTLHRTVRSKYHFALLATALLMCPARPAQAQQDILSVLVPKSLAVPLLDDGVSYPALGTFGYDPTSNTFYTMSFSPKAEIRKITTDAGNVQTATPLVSQSAWYFFLRNGDPNVAQTGVNVVGGLLLNPQTVGANAPYTFAVITDGGSVIKQGATNRNEITQRVYSYNLGAGPAVLDAGNPGSGIFTSLATKAQNAAAIGLATPTTTATADNVGRQSVWSSSGQQVYFMDSSTGFGGLWVDDVAAGSGHATQILAGVGSTSEPGMLPIDGGAGQVGGVDRIFFAGPTASNPGGLSFSDYNGSTATTAASYLTATYIKDTLKIAATPDIRSITADSTGNVFAYDNANSVLIRIDADKHLSVVANRAERTAAVGAANNFMNRMQPRSIDYTNPDTLETFPVTQIMYAEASSANLIAGVNVFLPGDFSRDNALDAADLALLETELIGQAAIPAPAFGQSDWKFDMNGDSKVNSNDVLVLSQFTTIVPGDANLDGTTEFTDLGILLNSYNNPGNWIGGDFDGNSLVDFEDLGILLNNYNTVTPTSGLAPAVPEPGSLWLLAVGAVLAGCGWVRRRRAI